MSTSYIDITGKTFNDLTAIKYVRSDKGQGAVWIWRCICEKEVEYPVHRVKRNHTLSCGCRRSRDCNKEKKCRHCGEDRLRLNRHGNPASVCHACYNKQTNGFKYKNPKTWMVQTAKGRAKRYEIPFDLTEDDFEIPKICPIFGTKLKVGTKKFHADSPSLDRIIASKGYVRGNVAVISHRANVIKNNGTPEEHRKIAEWMDSFSQPVLEAV